MTSRNVSHTSTLLGSEAESCHQITIVIVFEDDRPKDSIEYRPDNGRRALRLGSYPFNGKGLILSAQRECSAEQLPE
jgi:hypothetical protein